MEDAIDCWHGLHQLDTVEIYASSWDYHSLSLRLQGAFSADDSGTIPNFVT